MQLSGGSAVPLTNLTWEHWGLSVRSVFLFFFRWRGVMDGRGARRAEERVDRVCGRSENGEGECETYTKENAVLGVGNNTNETLLALPVLRNRNDRLTHLAQPALLNNGEDLRPVPLARLVRRGAQQPVALRVRTRDGDGVAVDVEVRHIVVLEVEVRAAAGPVLELRLVRGLLLGWVVDAEVGGCRCGEEEGRC